MKNIAVGDYVRTNDGLIFKIFTKTKTTYGFCGLTDSSNKKYSTYTYGKGNCIDNNIKGKIVKHSKNIIDLIEVGDFVNNGYIHEVGSADNGERWVHNLNGLLLYKEDIKTILTKEQMEANQYYVEKDKGI